MRRLILIFPMSREEADLLGMRGQLVSERASLQAFRAD
jgi:hypothetical protein